MMTALPHDDPRIGSVLDGRYRILDRVSTGGMGVVYRGERLHLGRPVAIKFLLAQLTHDAAQLACFEREAQVMSRLSHPHCVPVTDFGVSDAPYLVMEYVSGRTLKQVLAHERISPARAVRLARQLLSGLAHAHAQGVVHHDVKPANIMLTDATGVGEQVRVLDFGLAKLREVGDDPEPTAPNWLAGTPQYMAPEQWQAGPIDPRTDLYAAGVVLFEMLTGRKPFEARAPLELMRAHAELTPPALSSVSPRLSGLTELDAVVQRALAKSPCARFASASEFAAALEALPALPEDVGPPLAEYSAQEIEALETTMAATRAMAERRRAPQHDKVVTHGSARAASRRRWAWLTAPIAACVWLGWTLGSSPHGSASNKPLRPTRSAPVQVAMARAPLPAPAPAGEPDLLAEAAPLTLEALLADEQYDAALAQLAKLRAVLPSDARLVYLEGRALYGKGWWREAYERYRQAIELDGSYRTDRQLASHLVRGLGSTSAFAMAREILRDDLRQDALRPLARAARNDHRSIVRERAQRLHDEIALER
jgi:tetratricopeptide (TPR) repeat protein